MHRQTKATAIPKDVKKRVYERDGGKCVLCGRNNGEPNAHFIARSQGGLGVEQNILTLCPECHRMFDQTDRRKEIRETLKTYLIGKYNDWDETKLIYKKWRNL